MSSGTQRPALSNGQRAFAERMSCDRAAPCAAGAVCLYRSNAQETTRWIVSPDGRVLDETVFDAGG